MQINEEDNDFEVMKDIDKWVTVDKKVSRN